MSKKRRKDKELAHLRREVEVLRAQITGQKPTLPPAPSTPPSIQNPAVAPKEVKEPAIRKPQLPPQMVDPKFIKADLIKSGVLTAIALGVIIAFNFIL